MRRFPNEFSATLGWALSDPHLVLGSGNSGEGFRLPPSSPTARVLSSPSPGEPHLMLWEAKTLAGRASLQGLDQTKALLSH